MINIFVYGTLRKREPNAQLLNSATCIAEQCWTNGLLYDTGYGYPAMTQATSLRIYGELYSVKEEVLVRLDQLEGYVEGKNDNLYERIEQTVYTDEGCINAYVYIASNVNLLKKKIPNGDWMKHKLSQKQNKSITGGN
jgi:gamma-glutamylcyclotransferase (GGCT)/AIG2-like uncharacterized protein YtfP